MEADLGRKEAMVEDTTQSLRELAVLQRVADAVSSSLDLDEILSHCLDLAREVARTDTASIYLRDERRALFVRRAARNDRLDPLELPLTLIEPWFCDRQACHVDLNDPELDSFDAVRAARTGGFRSVLALALRHRGRLIGMLALGFYDLVQIPESTRRTLEAMSRYQAAAIENARAHRLIELRARLAQELRQFGERALVPVTAQQVRRLILETALSLTSSDRGLIAGIQHNRARVLEAMGRHEELVGMAIPIDEPYLRETMLSHEPLVAEDTRLLSPSRIAELAETQGTASFLLLTMRHRGKPIGQIFVGSGTPRRYEAEEVEALRILASMAAEVLERTRAEATAAAERRRLIACIEHLPVTVLVIGPQGEFLQLNAAARQYMQEAGLPERNYFEAMSLLTVQELDGRGVPQESLLVVQALAGKTPSTREVVVRSNDGQRVWTLLAAAAPIFDDEGRVDSVVLGFQDVSALREAADAKDRFLRIASHELRSPVTSLRTTVQLLAMEMEIDASVITEERRGMLQRLDRQTGRLVRLVEELLDTARLGATEVPLRTADGDLVEVCRLAIETIARPDGPRLVLDAEGPVRGRWDLLRIEQVVTNLIGNAVRYSATDSEVRIEVRDLGDRVRLSVHDHGIGIPKAQLRDVFTPFFRAANAARLYRGGLGLGLHITAEIVRRHGGLIDVVSDEGVGSSFTVELPRVSE